MFNTTIIRPDHGDHYHSHNTTVIEKRAPTDESAKMLREYERAADKRWIETVRVSDNTFNMVFYCERNYREFHTDVRAVFTINGKKIVVDGQMPMELPDMQARCEWVEKTFMQQCGERIAWEAIGVIFKQMKHV